jgi:hypothetical protein
LYIRVPGHCDNDQQQSGRPHNQLAAQVSWFDFNFSTSHYTRQGYQHLLVACCIAWHFLSTASLPMELWWQLCSHVNIVAIATVLTTIASIAYPPLLQRSSTIAWEEFATNTALGMYLPDQVMDGFTGTVDPTSSGGIDTSPEFLQVIDNTARNISVTTLDEPGFACNGTCYAWVTGAGLWANCTSGEQPVDLASSDYYQTGAPVFGINFSQYDGNNIPTLGTSVYYLSSVNDFCQGTIMTEECSVQAAIVSTRSSSKGTLLKLTGTKLRN